MTMLTLINGANLCARPCCTGPRLRVMDDAVMQERLAFAIRAAMARRGIGSARDLARRMNRDATTVNRWITGKSVPNALVIRPLADALGVKVEYLVDPPAVPEYPVDDYLIPPEVVEEMSDLARGATSSAREQIEEEAARHRAAEETRAAPRRKRPA